MTQRTVILDALQLAGSEGICISDLEGVDWTVVLTARNRVAELRRSGLDIESKPCLKHHHRGGVSRYYLRPKAAQLALL
jgi:hypothetical protein